MSLRYKSYEGGEIAEVIDAFAHLRITVFREWPYLYDGDFAYERAYLDRYTEPGTVLVAAFGGDKMVGAATGMPLAVQAEDFKAAFDGSGVDLASVFYCAESVLLPAYRGQGAGHVFFETRETHAKAQSFGFSAFCAVVRPGDHPDRPDTYRPLDPFWRKRGYTPLPGVIARFKWRDIGAEAENEKPLQFWMREL